MFSSRLVFLCFLITLIACSTPKEVDLVITNATIIDIAGNTTIPGQLIAISDGKIIAVDKTSSISSYSATEVIDIENRFIMPGLWDNHVHFRGGEALIEQNKEFLSLFLAFGITTVRDAGGDITPSLQEWNSEINQRVLDGPTIFTSGPKLDGSRPAWEGSLTVIDEHDVLIALDSLESIQADYVKVYDGNLTKEAYYAIIEEAEKRGFKTTGHMPLSADLMEAISLGLDGTEHLYYPLKEATLISDSLTQLEMGYRMITPLMENYDEALAASAFTEIANSEFYVTPTLHVGKTLAELLLTDHSSDSMLEYLDPAIIDTYQRRLNSAIRGGDSYTKQRAFWVESFRAMVKPMYDAGILVLAGSDSGPFNSFTYPGESIHKELQLFVAAGLTPQEALMTSIIFGPKFFDLEDSYGSISNGKIADLLILDENPLEDISNTRSINSVIQKGKNYSKKDLDLLLENLKN